MTVDSPTVSVVINNYNYGRFLADAIRSALCSPHRPLEVIVVDDGSTDESKQVIASFGQTITTVLKERGGQASALNEGLSWSKGNIICLLDSDDAFFPGKIAAVVGMFNEWPGADWLFHDLSQTDEHLIVACEPPPSTAPPMIYDERERMHRGQLPRCPRPATTGLCFRRALLQRIFPIPSRLHITADEFIKLAALAIAPGIYSPAPLAYQRIHSANAYTGRQDIQQLRAQIGLITNIELGARFPNVRRYADRSIGHAIGSLAGHSGVRSLLQVPEFVSFASSVGGRKAIVAQSPRFMWAYIRARRGKRL